MKRACACPWPAGLTDPTPSPAPDLTNLTAEVGLYRSLLSEDRYAPAVRPALNPAQTLKVKLQVELISVDGLVSARIPQQHTRAFAPLQDAV